MIQNQMEPEEEKNEEIKIEEQEKFEWQEIDLSSIPSLQQVQKMKKIRMAKLLYKIPYSPFIGDLHSIQRLTLKQMRETLIKIIVVSGMDIAAAE